jgi:hypothetical protein
MIRWICVIKPGDGHHREYLLSQLHMKSIEVLLQTNQLRQLAHMERRSGWMAEVRNINMAADSVPDRPKLSWDDLVTPDKAVR